MVAGVAPGDVETPHAVLAVAAGRRVHPVWRNELGGMTFAVGDGHAEVYVKWAPRGSGLDLHAEASRLRWAAPYVPVPAVLAEGADADGTWLLLRPLPGENAVTDRWRRDPLLAVRAIGSGLRALHEALPVRSCPFTWSAEERVRRAQHLAATGAADPRRWHEDTRRLGAARALDILATPPPTDGLVVCHGDACSPNTLLGDDGRVTGYVDFGRLGVADRWADVAVASWSVGWNYGRNWEEKLLEAYGVSPDPERMTYYRVLWDLS